MDRKLAKMVPFLEFSLLGQWGRVAPHLEKLPHTPPPTKG